MANEVFDHLKSMMRDVAADLVTVHEEPGLYYLETQHIMKNGKPLFFGKVEIGKRYVSYHLMPVYVDPTLLDDISPELRARMQGKSCFNFTAVDDELFAELAGLTRRGVASYRKAGYL